MEVMESGAASTKIGQTGWSHQLLTGMVLKLVAFQDRHEGRT